MVTPVSAPLLSPPVPLTTSQLQLIFPAAQHGYLQKVVDDLNRGLAAYGLDTAQRKAHFFAQVRQESGAGLEVGVESLQYSAQGLMSTFEYYRLHPAEAAQDGYERDPVTRKIRRNAAQETIGNKAYGGRNGNGDIASGDGYRYRGRGLIQVTGRSNYDAITRQCNRLYPAIGIDFIGDAETMAAFPGSVRSAVGFWSLNGLHRLADRGTAGDDVDRITAVINKKTDSYADRRANFAMAMHAFT